MKHYLGDFEELVLLTIARLGADAYGLALKGDIDERTGRNISIGALHTTLTKLEERGFVKSWLGDPTQERGGRRKRQFELTQSGKGALHQMKDMRDELWRLSGKTLAIAR